MTAGVLGVVAILAAYAHRLKTGQGQKVETSLLEAGILHTAWQSAIFFATGKSPGPLGSAHPLSAPYQAIQTADGWINIGAANQANWLRLIEIIGLPRLGDDERFRDNAARLHNLPALIELLTARFRERPTDEWLALLEAGGVPAGPVLTIEQMVENPQVQARDMVVEVEHKKIGSTRALGTPVKFSATPTRVRRAAPLLGEHTREILAEYGLAPAEIDKLIHDGDVLAA
jgi:crotonobetainyl-CoA:carnitine CoA-transferase CaiB-like acyl-CoA transferase